MRNTRNSTIGITDLNDPLFWIHINMDYPFNMKGLYTSRSCAMSLTPWRKIKLYYNQVFVADNIKEVIPNSCCCSRAVWTAPSSAERFQELFAE